MPTNQQDIDLANKVLSYLRDNVGVGSYSDTSRIAFRCDVPRADQADLRNMLNRLHRLGMVERAATGSKLRWSVKGATWDHTNPFRGLTGMPVQYSNTKASGQWEVTGDTYHNRDAIKSIPGWKWNKEDSVWSIPKTDANKAAMERIGLGVTEYTPAVKEPEAPEAFTPEEPGETPAEPLTTESHAVVHRLKLRVEGLERSEKMAREQLADLRQQHTSLQAVFAGAVEAAAAQCAEFTKLKEAVRANVRTIKVERYDGTTATLENKVMPKVFDKVASLARCRRNILLVGPAGCGKSYLAKLVYQALGLPMFGKVGGSEGLDETHLIGYSRPNLTTGKDKFVTTQFLECFEKGGLCLLDEIDRANPNVMLVLNSALDGNGDLPVPTRGDIAKKSKDFVCVATGNTYGRGADRMYAGANQLDEATIDRFRIGIVEMDYDPVVDEAVCPNEEVRTWCQTVRQGINRFGGMRRIMSSRFMEDANIMVEQGGWTLADVQETFFAGWSRDEKAKVMSA